MTTSIILLIILCLLNVIDYVQTIYSVQLLGVAGELNPIARLLMESSYGWVKLLIVPILALAIFAIIKTDKSFVWVAWVAVILYLLVVMNNFVVAFQVGILF